MARSSLEANQVSIAAKDNQIQQLLSALEEEKHRNSQSNGSNANNFNNMGSEELHIPRKFLCRVDVDDLIWVLVEYEDMDDTWKCFGNETSLNDFIQRIPGVPFTCPQKCLTVEESIQIADTSKRKLDKIMEEFRRLLLILFPTEFSLSQTYSSLVLHVKRPSIYVLPSPSLSLSLSLFLSLAEDGKAQQQRISCTQSIITTATAFLFVHFFAVFSTCFTHQNT